MAHPAGGYREGDPDYRRLPYPEYFSSEKPEYENFLRPDYAVENGPDYRPFHLGLRFSAKR